MSLISALPNLDGAKIIVIDEGAEAAHAESLIASWFPLWISKENRVVHLLLFSDGKRSSEIAKSFAENERFKVHDYYTSYLEKTDALKDNKKLFEIEDLSSLNNNSTVIIDSLSSLIVCKGLSETCKFVDKIGAKVSQLVCVYQRDFTPRKIPSVKTLGTSYVRIEPTRGLKIDQNLSYRTLTSHFKPGGGITQQTEIVVQDLETHEIRIEKVAVKETQTSVTTAPKPATKIQASFRIEINDKEMEQRNATPLPYIIGPSLPLSESKIHYQPDEVDDIDEEDPDDDLDF